MNAILPILSVALKFLVNRYSGYAVSVGMMAHGVYQITGPDGVSGSDPQTGVKTILAGAGMLIGLHHTTGISATVNPAPVAEAAK